MRAAVGGEDTGVLRTYTYDALGNRLSATGQVRFTTPAVFCFEPQMVVAGDRVNIFGRNFPFEAKGGVSVAIGGKPAQVLSVAPNVITVLVPAGNAGGALSVALPGKKSISLGELHVLDEDEDRDCIPLPYELALGLDPNNPDSDGDGISDGDEDTDLDGIVNCQEIRLGTRPDLADSDGDRLSDPDEIALGTDPLCADSDGDGFLDGEEVEAGSNPKDRGSIPPGVFQVSPGSYIGQTFSILNAVDPSTQTQPGQTRSVEAVGMTFSILNAAAPPIIGGGNQQLEVLGATFSVLNRAAPVTTGGGTSVEAVGATFSILNAAPPPVRDVVGATFSIKNLAK